MMLEVVFFFLYGEMFWSTRVSLVTGVKKWTDSQFKKKSGLNAVRMTVSVTSKDTLKPAQWMCVNEYQIIYRSPRARHRVHAFMSNSV